MYIHVCVGVMAVTAGGRPVREVGELGYSRDLVMN